MHSISPFLCTLFRFWFWANFPFAIFCVLISFIGSTFIYNEFVTILSVSSMLQCQIESLSCTSIMCNSKSSTGLAFPPLYFYNGGVKEFLGTIKQHVFLVRLVIVYVYCFYYFWVFLWKNKILEPIWSKNAGYWCNISRVLQFFFFRAFMNKSVEKNIFTLKRDVYQHVMKSHYNHNFFNFHHHFMLVVCFNVCIFWHCSKFPFINTQVCRRFKCISSEWFPKSYPGVHLTSLLVWLVATATTIFVHQIHFLHMRTWIFGCS